MRNMSRVWLAVFIVGSLICLSQSCGTFGRRSELMGICVEECFSHDDCNLGKKCLFNGCGHTCMQEAPTIPPFKKICIKTGAPCRCLCFNGYKVDEDGCKICECLPGKSPFDLPNLTS